MRYLNITTGQLLSEPNGDPAGTAANPLQIPRTDSDDELQLLISTPAGDVPVLLPAATEFKFELFLAGKYESNPIVAMSPAGASRPADPAPGTAAGVYTFQFLGNTVEAQQALKTPDGNPNNDLDFVLLAGQISWKVPGASKFTDSQRIYAQLQNVYSGAVSVTSASPARYKEAVEVVEDTEYALSLDDNGKMLVFTTAGSSATIPEQSDVDWPEGASIRFVSAANSFTLAGAGAVALNSLNSPSANVQIAGQFGTVELKRIGDDEWVAFGDVTPSA